MLSDWRWTRTEAFTFASNTNNCIRKVNPLGIISTVAGNGEFGGTVLDYAPGTLAISVAIEGAGSVALDGKGGFYVTGEDEVRKVNADGTIAVSVRGINFAGQGYRGYGGDGGPAIDGVLNANSG